MTSRRALLTALLSLVPLAAACGGSSEPCGLDAAACMEEVPPAASIHPA